MLLTPTRLVNPETTLSPEELQPKSNPFALMGLEQALVRAVAELGFVEPSEIQAAAIPALLTGEKDMLGLAQTGTGKTAAFGLPLSQLIDAGLNKTQAIVLAPTRELCVQIARDLESYNKYRPHFKIVAVYGGANISTQIRSLRGGVQVIVATPGRFKDLYERGEMDLTSVRWVVLDEADEMLNMGFRDAIDEILSFTPDTKFTWLFSATMLPEVRRIADTYMTDPITVQIGKRNSGAEKIEHVYYQVAGKDKYLALKRIVDYSPDIFGLIFCRTKMEAQEVAESLAKDGYNADSLHGDLNQAQRDRVMGRFRSRQLQLLVATDVAARGIDVDNVTHVVHYNLPDDLESYTHRAGRTARAGRSGISLSIISSRDMGKIKQLERSLNRQFTKLPVPTGAEVVEKRLLHLVSEVVTTEVKPAQMEPLMESLNELLGRLSREELIQHFISYQFSNTLTYYANVPDLNLTGYRAEPGRDSYSRDNSSRDSSSRDSYRSRGESDGNSRSRSPREASANGQTNLYINVGTLDGITKEGLLELITGTAGIGLKDIGKVQLRDIKAYFEVPDAVVDTVLETFQGTKFRSRRVRVDYADDNSGSGGGYTSRNTSARSGFDTPRRTPRKRNNYRD